MDSHQGCCCIGGTQCRRPLRRISCQSLRGHRITIEGCSYASKRLHKIARLLASHSQDVKITCMWWLGEQLLSIALCISVSGVEIEQLRAQRMRVRGAARRASNQAVNRHHIGQISATAHTESQRYCTVKQCALACLQRRIKLTRLSVSVIQRCRNIRLPSSVALSACLAMMSDCLASCLKGQTADMQLRHRRARILITC
jgi:hypothetical protein